jgi:hypothetical protein
LTAATACNVLWALLTEGLDQEQRDELQVEFELPLGVTRADDDAAAAALVGGMFGG